GGMYVLQLLDWYSASISVILVCIVEAIIVGWIYGCSSFICDLEFMIGEKINLWWRLCWKYITPTILLFIFVTTIAFNTTVTYNRKAYPYWALIVGWFTAVLSMMWIPIYIIYKLLQSKGTFSERLKFNLKPTTEWCPASEEDRINWKNYKDISHLSGLGSQAAVGPDVQ
ncbi:hypothetical protein L9F63_004019, partial [Diploptera punctata]